MVSDGKHDRKNPAESVCYRDKHVLQRMILKLTGSKAGCPATGPTY